MMYRASKYEEACSLCFSFEAFKALMLLKGGPRGFEGIYMLHLVPLILWEVPEVIEGLFSVVVRLLPFMWVTWVQI